MNEGIVVSLYATCSMCVKKNAVFANTSDYATTYYYAIPASQGLVNVLLELWSVLQQFHFPIHLSLILVTCSRRRSLPGYLSRRFITFFNAALHSLISYESDLDEQYCNEMSRTVNLHCLCKSLVASSPSRSIATGTSSKT